MRITVNADDFGKNREVTLAIAECFEKGVLSTTTLMVNMPYADEAAALAKEMGFQDRVGLHLNLTGGAPLTRKIRERKTFCGADGRFHGNFHRNLRTRLILGAADRQAACEELKAQIEKYLAYGFRLRHLDSHHHVHTNLPVLKALEPLIAEYKIASVRISRNLFEESSLFHRVYKKYYNQRLRKLPIATTDYFGGFTDFQEHRQIVGENQSVEVMLHPMYGEGGALMDTDTPMEEVVRTLADAGWERKAGAYQERSRTGI